MKAQRIRYRAYMLRLWLVDGGDWRTWRASLEDPHTGNRQAFADLAALYAFLQELALGQLENSERQNDEYSTSG